MNENNAKELFLAYVGNRWYFWDDYDKICGVVVAFW